MSARDSSPNATGRASGKQSGKAQKVATPPRGEPWVWLTRELLHSPAWCSMSINCRKLVDFLMCDHMNHAGLENGDLMATYDQLVSYGLTRSQISPAIREAEYLRLIRVERGGRRAGTNQPSTYEMTFLPVMRPSPREPTNDWRKTTEADVKRFRELERRRQPKNRIPSSTLRTTVVPLYELPRAN